MLKELVNVYFAVGLLVNALLFIPQSIRLIKSKDSQEVSLITFLGFLLIQFGYTCHALVIKDKFLFYGTLLSDITNFQVVWLIIYYRIRKKRNCTNEN